VVKILKGAVCFEYQVFLNKESLNQMIRNHNHPNNIILTEVGIRNGRGIGLGGA
jgi:hypothetical protein